MCGLSLLVVSSQYHLFGTGPTFRKKIGVTLFDFQPTSPRVVSLPGLAIQNRLSTDDRLVLFGVITSSCCIFCSGSENHDHLFFNCPFTAQVWDSISAKLNVQWQAHSLSDWVTLLSSFKGKTLRVTTIKLAFTLSVYNIWIERNLRKFQHIQSPIATVVGKICADVRCKLLSLAKLPKGDQSTWFIAEWNLSNSASTSHSLIVL